MGVRTSGKSIRGSVGDDIFAEVERLTADGKMSKLAAFGEIGTVAANYYRVARKRGAPLRQRRGAAKRVAKVAGGNDLERALAALAKAIRDQQDEIERLRSDNARMAEVRKLLRA